MCVYSMMADGWMFPKTPKEFGPNPITTPAIPMPGMYPVTPAPVAPAPEVPNAIPEFFKPSYIPLHKITPALASKMLKVLKLVDEIDKEVGSKDCLLNAAEKKQFVENLRKIAGEPCEDC